MRKVPDVVGMRMRDEDGLDPGLLSEREFGREGPGIDSEPVVDQVASQVMFSV